MKRFVLLIGALILSGSAQNLHAQAGKGKITAPPTPQLLHEISKGFPTMGREFFVDPVSGHDDWPGSPRGPWRSVNHALKVLKPGDVLNFLGTRFILDGALMN
jgi:hypothetical protein